MQKEIYYNYLCNSDSASSRRKEQNSYFKINEVEVSLVYNQTRHIPLKFTVKQITAVMSALV